jgi:hypothetical protein
MDDEGLRQVREYVAWILLAAAVIVVGIGAWQFLGLPGSATAAGPFVSAGGSTGYSAIIGGSEFAWRADEVVSDFVSVDVTVLPVAAVLLVALVGRLAASAWRITLTAVVIQVVALVLGLVAWVAAFSVAGRWFPITVATDLAVAAAGLILTIAVLRSPALRGSAKSRLRRS